MTGWKHTKNGSDGGRYNVRFGITGGVGAGKSTVLRLIKENFNASVIEADEVGRMLMEPGNGAYLKIVEIFGEDILDNPGEQGSTINRAKLAGIVFNNKNKRMVLNGIVHPLVKKYITEEIGRIRCAEKYDYVFVEAALLIEDHYDIYVMNCGIYMLMKKQEGKGLSQAVGIRMKKLIRYSQASCQMNSSAAIAAV